MNLTVSRCLRLKPQRFCILWAGTMKGRLGLSLSASKREKCNGLWGLSRTSALEFETAARCRAGLLSEAEEGAGVLRNNRAKGDRLRFSLLVPVTAVVPSKEARKVACPLVPFFT